MKSCWPALLITGCMAAQSAALSASPLTLEEALAAASSPHPDWRAVEADLEVARADRSAAGSRQDFALYLEGALRTGRRPDGDWKPDNIGRLVARKPLFDFGRTDGAIKAAEHAIEAAEAALFSVESQRRLDIMARFFDVLIADMQFAADNEFMAVAYVAWDNAGARLEVGHITRPQLLKLEADYQDVRERRNASQQRQRLTRQKLAHALNRPDALPSQLASPVLTGNGRPLPEFERLLNWVMAHNPGMRALEAQIAGSGARSTALRAEQRPSIDAEVTGGRYSRESSTRDEMSAGLVLTVPLYQGRRLDARAARERAALLRLESARDALRLELADAVLSTLQEIEWLRGSARPAAEKQIEYRDWALERARAEYELEMKTNLGTSMAETQAAQLRRKQVEYRLALALARLEALAGGKLPFIEEGDTP